MSFPEQLITTCSSLSTLTDIGLTADPAAYVCKLKTMLHHSC